MSAYTLTVRGRDDADALAQVTAQVDAFIAGTSGFPPKPEHQATRAPVLAAVSAFLAVVPDDPGMDVCVAVFCSVEDASGRHYPTEHECTGANLQVSAHLALRENP
jgi:hypothetical protein